MRMVTILSRREPGCRLGLTHPFGPLQGEGGNGLQKNQELIVQNP
jgi:hypothetical protein